MMLMAMKAREPAEGGGLIGGKVPCAMAFAARECTVPDY
jgi:hypothetical protein